MDSEKGNRVFARGGGHNHVPPLVFGAQKKPGLDRVKVVNTNASSYMYVNRPVHSVLESAATAKKIKHKQACADRRADFTPFVCSTDGAVHREGQHFLRRLAARLATKWEMPYARVMNFVRTRLSIAILGATGHCVRGARRKLFSLSTGGGWAVALFS